MTEDLLKAFEIVRNAVDYLKAEPVLKIVGNIFLVSAMLFSMLQICGISSILGNMYNTIKAVIFLSMLFSGAGILSLILLNCIESKYNQVKAKRERIREDARREQERIAYQAEQERLLSTIGVSGRALLKYVDSHGGMAWLPLDEIAVLNLYNKGILEPLYSGYAAVRSGSQCFAFRISSGMAECLTREKEAHQGEWEEIIVSAGLDKYQ